jgi:hypothetical protein
MRIALEFSADQGSVHRARLGYAFSLFCAIRGHHIVSNDETNSADVYLTYATRHEYAKCKPLIRLSNLYRARSMREQAPPPAKFERDGQETVLLYPPHPGAEPDWLAEIFEWVSCADEYSIQKRDSVGRIDFRDSYAGRHGLDVGIPYAAVAMQFLQQTLSNSVPGLMFEPEFGFEEGTHFVINTHDVDILPAGYFGSIQRLAKYALISLMVFKSPKLAAVQVGKVFSMAAGGINPLDQTPNLLRKEMRNDVGATYFFIPRRQHRRDANYGITDPAVRTLMEFVKQQGMEVALHGSYKSLDCLDGLASEFNCLREQELRPQGNRQHWLRFTLEKLIPAVELSGALYDSSIGWNHLGFRAGACFPYPPYNFEYERPASFLEIPLVVMEQGLVTGGRPEERWFGDVARILSTSRRYGWGGVSILWHPTAFGGGQLPMEIERVFWKLIEQKKQWNDTWTSCIDLVKAISDRYINAGLLPRGYGSECFSVESFARPERIPESEMAIPGVQPQIN